MTTAEAGLEKMECVRLGGAWCAQAEELGLETPDKNPLTIAVDCEKFIVSRSHLSRGMMS